MLEGGFSARIRAIVPAPPIDALVDALDDGTKAYAAIGVGSIREALVTLGGWQAYRSAREQDRLHVRVRVLVNLDPLTSLADRLALIEAIAPDLAIGDSTPPLGLQGRHRRWPGERCDERAVRQ